MKGMSGPKGDGMEQERRRQGGGLRLRPEVGEEKGREDKEKGAGGPPY